MKKTFKHPLAGKNGRPEHTAPADPAPPAPKPESVLMRIARERREARAATGAAPPPVMPRTKLKRRHVREVIREVEKKPLMLKHCDLTFHPHLKRVGLLPALIEREQKKGNEAGKNRHDHKGNAEALSQEFEALKLSILDHGLREPLKVCRNAKGNWEVVDGRHRFQAALRIIADNSILNAKHSHNPAWLANADKLENEGLPCVEIQPHEVSAVIMDAVKRRHFSKGALAYLAVLIHPAIATEERRGGDRSKSAETALLTLDARIADFSKHTGVSERTMKYAIRLYKVLTSREDARLKFEPSIWVGASLDVLLGGVEHFLKYGAEETQETEEEKAAALKQAAFLQFAVRLADVGKCWVNWEILGPVLQQSMIDLHVHKAFAGAPAELRAALIQALSTETKS